MRVPYSWIASYLAEAPPAAEAAQILSRQGLLVEHQEEIGAGLEAFLAVEVVATRQISAHLQAAVVSTGRETVEVVSGAPNLRAGGHYPWAPPGSVLPSGRRIGEAVFVGQTSAGMLLSAQELGVGAESDELLELPDGPGGQSLTEVLGLPETVFDIDLTPNLAVFCQHVVGLAEELAAGLGRRVRLPTAALPEGRPALSGRVEPAEIAPTYLLARLAGPPAIASPLWLKRRLWDSGLRTHNLYVDVTNYIAMAWGQPLHAFDLDQIKGDVRVRLAAAGETVVTLDGISRKLGPDDIVIADDLGVLNVAGILGGRRGAISESSSHVLIEAAAFDPVRIRRTFRRLGLPTDAALRFQRGVDRARSGAALADALAILAAAGAGPAEMVAGVEAPLPPARRLTVRPERVAQFLGYPIGEAQMANCLSRLGLAATVESAALVLEVPDRRRDVATEADVAEEVGRLIGYDQIPETPLPSRQVGSAGADWDLVREVRHWLLGMGLSEHWGHSLLAEREVMPFGRAAALGNPLSVEEAWLRPALSASLLKALAVNLAFRHEDLRLFEVGRVFVPARDAVREEDHLAALLTGGWPRSWTGTRRPIDLFSGKGVLGALADRLHLPLTLAPGSSYSFLHPHRQFTVRLGDQEIGWLGEAHPALLPERLKQAVVLWELALSPLVGQSQVPKVRLPSRQPTVQRDLAVVVPEAVGFAAVEAAVKAAAGRQLSDVALFDLYRGPQVGAGRKSLALRLTFSDPQRTLTEAEVDDCLRQVSEALTRIGGDLRRG